MSIAVGAVLGVDGAVELEDLPVLARQDAAALVRRRLAGVSDDLLDVASREFEHVLPYFAWGNRGAQSPVDRYFQPPSPTRRAKLPRSYLSATTRAAWSTAPEEGPANMPSVSASSRAAAKASACVHDDPLIDNRQVEDAGPEPLQRVQPFDQLVRRRLHADNLGPRLVAPSGSVRRR